MQVYKWPQGIYQALVLDYSLPKPPVDLKKCKRGFQVVDIVLCLQGEKDNNLICDRLWENWTWEKNENLVVH